MADIELIVKIPENYILANIQNGSIASQMVLKAVRNGKPLEKHDEEVIKETVESIWGKPPYNEVLDKIRAEIDGAKLPKNRMSFFRDGINCALEIIDKYRTESEE
jgi:hypothetical protein